MNSILSLLQNTNVIVLRYLLKKHYKIPFNHESPMKILNFYNGWGIVLYFKVKENIINNLKYIKEVKNG